MITPCFLFATFLEHLKVNNFSYLPFSEVIPSERTVLVLLASASCVMPIEHPCDAYRTGAYRTDRAPAAMLDFHRLKAVRLYTARGARSSEQYPCDAYRTLGALPVRCLRLGVIGCLPSRGVMEKYEKF